jgi:acetyl esterase/lipase
MLKKGLMFIVIAAAAGYFGWTASPWPSALFYRVLFDRGGVAMHEALAKHVPTQVAEQIGIPYSPGDADAQLDIFRPPATEGRALPVIVWVHGGAFLSGSKNQIANYLRILAGRGYAAVGVDYTLAPGGRYPQPIRQINEALRFLDGNADRFGLDRSRIFLAGDSAGAQIAAQVTAAVSSPAYAARLEIKPSIAREQLRGSILFCGVYEIEMVDATGPFAGFLRTASWSYFGTKDFSGDARAADFSILRNASATFPPLFVTAGNADPLLPQSRKLAEVAKAEGVVLDTLFFPADYAPALPHEYQFNLDNEAGQLALRRALAFLATNSR